MFYFTLPFQSIDPLSSVVSYFYGIHFKMEYKLIRHYKLQRSIKIAQTRLIVFITRNAYSERLFNNCVLKILDNFEPCVRAILFAQLRCVWKRKKGYTSESRYPSPIEHATLGKVVLLNTPLMHFWLLH